MSKQKEGVIVASDQTLEWILPWWLKQYQKHNSYPVAFIDLGLSFEKKVWCKQHGEYIPLRVVDFAEEPDSETETAWIKDFGSQFKESRNAWFKKPLACLQSPFERTIWIDIDCEIRGSISPLFEFAKKPIGFGMVKESFSPSKGYSIYNSGVIAFRQNHPLLLNWAEDCLKLNKHFLGDQDILSHIIAEKGISIEEIPPIFNWSRCQADLPEAIIQHWHGYHGKYVIQHLAKEADSSIDF
jgi:hypothetical protein